MTEQTIFLSALEIADPTERAAYLEQVCTGDSALRRQVEALLAAHQRSGLFLDEPALEQASVRPGGPSARTVSADELAGPDTPTLTGPGSAAGRDDDLCFLKPPTRPDSLGRLDRYDIFEVLGRGGFGTVLRAFDDRLHRVVAIKVLAPQLATSGPARQRFHREARAGAAVRDEHVVNIHEVSEPDEPVPYLVMEYVAGQTLQQKLDRTGPLSVPEILRIGSQVAKGLAAAHATGHIHRDIKPSNILLENGVERVKLTDFGLARAVDDASISHSGLVAGTPMYMAPEQAKGERIDHRADLFSLGSVLYAMCTGHSPFRASTTMAVLKRVCEEDPRPVREVNPEVPEWLAAVIAKLHGKKPPDRFQSAKEVAEVLQQHLAHLQQPNLVARPPAVVPPPPSPRRWQAGDRVLAPWEPEWLYPATVQQTNADSVLVTYDDGDSSWQDAGAMRPLDIEPGARVFGWWNGPYYPGTVTAQDGNRIHIAYDDGDSEWTEFDCIRVAAAGPAPVTRPAVAEPVDRPLPPALQRLRLPANGLFVTGILYWATLPVVFVARFMPGVPDDAFPWLLRSFGVVPVVAGFVFVFAAWKMRRGELYPLCVAAALLPLALVGEKLFSLAQGKLTISPGDFTALPFGLWALIELTRSDVRAAFGRARLEASGPFRPPAAPPRRRPRWAVAAVVALVLVALGAVFGHAALLYLSDRGELELVSQDGVVSVIVLKNDDGVIDGNKLHPTVTDWLEMKGGHTLKLPPGKYQLNAGTWPANTRITHWQVTTSSPFGSHTLRVPGEGLSGLSAIVTVERGRHTSVRPVVGPAPPPTEPPSSSPEVPRTAAVQALRDAVAAKERSTDVAKARYEAGAASLLELTVAQIELIEARVQLAEAERDTATIRARLQELVTLRQTDRDLMEQLVQAGRSATNVLSEADARLAAARARLAQTGPVLPAGPQPVRLRSFTPVKDPLPLPHRGPASAVTAVGDAWRIENTTNAGNFNVMVAQAIDNLPKDGVLIFRAKVKVEAKERDEALWGELGFGGPREVFPSWDQWPEVRARYADYVTEWTEKEAHLPAAEIQKKGPTVYLYAGLHANGVLWLKDVELLHLPPAKK